MCFGLAAPNSSPFDVIRRCLFMERCPSLKTKTCFAISVRTFHALLKVVLGYLHDDRYAWLYFFLRERLVMNHIFVMVVKRILKENDYFGVRYILQETLVDWVLATDWVGPMHCAPSARALKCPTARVAAWLGGTTCLCTRLTGSQHRFKQLSPRFY